LGKWHSFYITAIQNNGYLTTAIYNNGFITSPRFWIVVMMYIKAQIFSSIAAGSQEKKSYNPKKPKRESHQITQNTVQSSIKTLESSFPCHHKYFYHFLVANHRSSFCVQPNHCHQSPTHHESKVKHLHCLLVWWV
jgi:hypothetical protein